MFKWIGENKTWNMFLVISLLGVSYLGYTNLWEPLLIIENTKNVLGETVDFTKELIEFVTQKDITEFIKVLTPFLLPLITWKIKNKMFMRKFISIK